MFAEAAALNLAQSLDDAQFTTVLTKVDVVELGEHICNEAVELPDKVTFEGQKIGF
jgi:hypothetical protein